MKIYDVHLRVRAGDSATAETIERDLHDVCGDLAYGVAVEDVKPRYLSLDEVDRLAAHIHDGQEDKIGVPYVEHVRSVAAGLETFDQTVQAAGLLHDAIEDGEDWTAERLLAERVDPVTVRLVEQVTNVPGQKYPDKIEAISRNYQASLIKIADNAHNSREDRRRNLDEATRQRLDKKYAKARAILWNAVRPVDVETILERINPDLLPKLYAMHPNLKTEVPW